MVYKNYRITPLGTYVLFKIQPPGSGDIPDVLSGLYTSKTVAMQAIDRYLNGLTTKRTRKSNGSKGSATNG